MPVATCGSAVAITIPIVSISWHGGTRVLVELANHLARRGHAVTFLVSRGRFTTPFKLDPDVRIEYAGIRTRWKYLDYAVFLLRLPFIIPGHAILIANHFVTYYPVRMRALLGLNRYVYFVQDIESKYKGLMGRLLNLACNLTYGDKYIVAANRHLQHRLASEFSRECRSVDVGPNAAFFSAAKTVTKVYDIIYFARREVWKGLDRFLEFVALSGGRMSILCVSQDQELRGRVESSSVVFRKPNDDTELVSCIDQSRLLLLTSYEEGFSLPPLEAMARGVPTILFPCGGPDLYIRDGVNALYISTVQQAVEAAAGLISTPVAYQEMSRNARATAAGYRLESALEQLSSHIEAVASGSDPVC
jgi:glycosyltransferase involved in cell wall biosynthesis